MQAEMTIKKTLNILWIAITLLIVWMLLFHPDWIVAGPPAHAAGLSDKSDGQCTGLETAGRCADKCANPGDTLQGYDKETGAAVCRSAPTGCPYGDSVPVGPECDKLAAQVNVYNEAQAADPAPAADPTFAGK